MPKKRNVLAQFDGGGGSDGKKKVYGVNIVDADTQEVLHMACGLIDEDKTFNEAEWTAAKSALAICWLFREEISSVVIQGDSQLVVYQLSGKYKCGKKHLLVYHDDSKVIEEKLLNSGIGVEYSWVRREKNTKADELGRLI